MSSPIPALSPKRTNRAIEASTIRLALDTTQVRRRKRASQCRCRAWSRSMPCVGSLPTNPRPCGITSALARSAPGTPPSRRCSKDEGSSAPPARAAGSRCRRHDPRTPSQPRGLKHDPEPSRPRACRSFFEKVPHLVELDHHGPALRLGFLGVDFGEPLDPDHRAGGRDAQQLGGAVHRQATQVEQDGRDLDPQRQAARRRVGEVQPAALAAVALLAAHEPVLDVLLSPAPPAPQLHRLAPSDIPSSTDMGDRRTPKTLINSMRKVLLLDYVRHTHLKISFGPWMNTIICPIIINYIIAAIL